MLWWCVAWKSAHEPFLTEVMILARGIKLGALLRWPLYIRRRAPGQE